MRSRIFSSLLAEGTPLSAMHCMTLDIHMLLPCQHVLDVKSTLIEVLDLNWTNFLIAVRQHLKVWLPQKITPMDRLGAPGCTSCLLMSQGHDYLIRCHLPSLVAEELALAHCLAGVGRRAHRGRHTFLSWARSLKMSIYTKMMPWFCSEAYLCLEGTKVVSKPCTELPFHTPRQHSLHCNWWMDLLEPATAFATPQCSPQETQTDGWAWKTTWLAISKCFALLLPKRGQSQSETHRLYDFQSILTMKTAHQLQSRLHVSRSGYTMDIASACKSFSPLLLSFITSSRCEAQPPHRNKWITAQQEKTDQTDLCQGCWAPLEQQRP